MEFDLKTQEGRKAATNNLRNNFSEKLTLLGFEGITGKSVGIGTSQIRIGIEDLQEDSHYFGGMAFASDITYYFSSDYFGGSPSYVSVSGNSQLRPDNLYAFQKINNTYIAMNKWFLFEKICKEAKSSLEKLYIEFDKIQTKELT